MEAATRPGNCPSPCLAKGQVPLFTFVEKLPLLLTAAWAGQAGWEGRARELALLGEKVGAVGKGLLLDSTADPST